MDQSKRGVCSLDCGVLGMQQPKGEDGAHAQRCAKSDPKSWYVL